MARQDELKPSDQSPIVYLIAGPNGAGKTTFATEFLPDLVQCREFVNADLIAAGLSPFAPEGQALRAGRLTLARIKELAATRQDFGFETTLAGRGYVKLINDLRASGYQTTLYFLWLPRAELAVSRVANRVRQGGHDIPKETILRRFEAGLNNFFTLYSPIVDSWHIHNGSFLPPPLVASSVDGSLQIFDPGLYQKFQAQRGD